ncbi:hypothetical protein LX32DRAFT_642290 [Colletotrichum zoysiae]|uniref:Uncharacterized protein n=1 Tax=Colletotrichum zoysiae TaxID=1216348 RepID=A0AAD9HBP8_9PEZI|nr:hypothetical protein LX32DRAFT_642290 [Colletotrichum zoysiae]
MEKRNASFKSPDSKFARAAPSRSPMSHRPANPLSVSPPSALSSPPPVLLPTYLNTYLYMYTSM